MLNGYVGASRWSTEILSVDVLDSLATASERALGDNLFVDERGQLQRRAIEDDDNEGWCLYFHFHDSLYQAMRVLTVRVADKKDASLVDFGKPGARNRNNAQLLGEASVRLHFGSRHVDGYADRIAVQPQYERAFELCSKAATTDAIKDALRRVAVILVFDEDDFRNPPQVAVHIVDEERQQIDGEPTEKLLLRMPSLTNFDDDAVDDDAMDSV